MNPRILRYSCIAVLCLSLCLALCACRAAVPQGAAATSSPAAATASAHVFTLPTATPSWQNADPTGAWKDARYPEYTLNLADGVATIVQDASGEVISRGRYEADGDTILFTMDTGNFSATMQNDTLEFEENGQTRVYTRAQVSADLSASPVVSADPVV